MTSEFASMEWDLQAVIGGWSSGSAATSSRNLTVNQEDPISEFGHGFEEQDQQLFFGAFPDVFDSSAAVGFFDELEGLYAPFCPETVAQETVRVSCQPLGPKQEDAPPQNNGLSSIASAASGTGTTAQVAKYRRRKNQQKRVVEQATAEGLSASDKWAWRKYGQKPIKGSAYPRSYYRCSSSKGCPARKQVEQSCADPAMYVITYSADHNHSHPTRRNSLSGVARAKQSPAARDHGNTCSPIKLTAVVKTEDEDNMGILFSDDLFPSLEDLHGCIMN